MIIWYTVPEIWCLTDVILIFHFGLFFHPFTPLTAQIIKIFKNEKKTPSDIIILLLKIIIKCCTVFEILCATDGRTDGRTDDRQTGGKSDI